MLFRSSQIFHNGNLNAKTWEFDTYGGIDLPTPGTVRGTTVNLVASNFAQLEWVDSANLNILDPNDSYGPKNWAYVGEDGFYVETNLNTGVGNTHSWWFDNYGRFKLPTDGDIKNSNGYSVIKSIPQNLQDSAANYTLVASDAGKHIYKNDGQAYGVEIPTDASVDFEIGTAITIVSGDSWTYIYPADNMTTEVWGAGFNTTSSSFYIPNNSIATLLKIGTDKWMLSGAGLAIV